MVLRIFTESKQPIVLVNAVSFEQKILKSYGSERYMLAQEMSLPTPTEELVYSHALMLLEDFILFDQCSTLHKYNY